jgi:hypothetical protein
VSRVGRLGGAILVETGSEFFLVGDTKRPCDWRAAGFESPGELDSVARPYVRLARSGPLNVAGPWLEMAGTSVDGEELARLLAARFLIGRNGSVSDRLWRLVLRSEPEGDDLPPDTIVDARWLAEAPSHVWEIVREKVLRCL